MPLITLWALSTAVMTSPSHMLHECRWGQQLARMDCVLRVAGRYRWVAIHDFDEYLVPTQAQTLSELLRRAGSKLVVQYTFPGRVLCSGCRHQYHLIGGGSSNNSAKQVPVAQGPRSGMGAACLEPAANFNHLLWSNVFSTGEDTVKNILDPMAVVLPTGHGHTHDMTAFNNIGGAVTFEPSVVRGLHQQT